jgi:hypothetical protein
MDKRIVLRHQQSSVELKHRDFRSPLAKIGPVDGQFGSRRQISLPGTSTVVENNESGLRDVIILFIPAPLWSVTQEIMCR